MIFNILYLKQTCVLLIIYFHSKPDFLGSQNDRMIQKLKKPDVCVVNPVFTLANRDWHFLDEMAGSVPR